MTIKCLIVDDEPLALDLLEKYVQMTTFLKLAGRCSSAIQAIQFMKEAEVDLLFLDIEMPEVSGLELSKSLKNGPRVIFTTAYERYALQGFKVDALDYLLKPFNYEEFLVAANKAKKWFDMIRQPEHREIPESIYVKSDYKLVRIELKNIIYIEGLKDYVKIFLDDRERPVITLLNMKTLEEKLPGKQFMRVHRSFIVNMAKIKTIERNRIVFGKEYIPVSEKYQQDFNNFIQKDFLNAPKE